MGEHVASGGASRQASRPCLLNVGVGIAQARVEPRLESVPGKQGKVRESCAQAGCSLPPRLRSGVGGALGCVLPRRALDLQRNPSGHGKGGGRGGREGLRCGHDGPRGQGCRVCVDVRVCGSSLNSRIIHSAWRE